MIDQRKFILQTWTNCTKDTYEQTSSIAQVDARRDLSHRRGLAPHQSWDNDPGMNQAPMDPIFNLGLDAQY
jgi:hypothetical protein